MLVAIKEQSCSGGEMFRRILLVLVIASFMFSLTAYASQSDSIARTKSPAAAFDVKAAVDAYLATVPADAHARSDAYFEGGYWLLLWDFLYGAGVALILLCSRISAKMRDYAERITRRRPLQTFVYWAGFLIITGVMSFPLTAYEGFFRERKYGLMNQTFSEWLGDQAKGFLVGIILGGVLMIVLFGIVRRLPKTWPVWGSAASIVFLMLTSLIGPVYIAPLFNQYTKLQDERVREPILSLARANGIPASEIWEVDASRQSNRVSANVSGFLGTERITLNDNLLKRCTLPEIETVMGHEMGHYVLNHVYTSILFFGVGALVFFAFLKWSLNRSLARWGKKWDIRGVGDTAVLPLAVLLGSLFFFVMTPVNNSWTRAQEYEADIFGLNAARQPDGEARVDLMLGEYRKLDPGRLEEILFFDHPSGRTRITAAMRWKAEHLAEMHQEHN
jgi:STE24 endopeptidase